MSINTSLSGLNAAATRLAGSASNIANINSTSRNENGKRINEPYIPVDTHQTSLKTGGVRAENLPRNPDSVEVYAPNNINANKDGIVKIPNISLDKELVNGQIATYDFNANLKIIKSYDEMLKNVLDIKS